MGKLLIFLAILTLGKALAAPSVIGGLRVSEDEEIAKITVSLVIDDRKLCTGTIISTKHILTAAHCLFNKKDQVARPQQIRVYFGLETKTAAYHLRAETFYMHEEFVGNDSDREDSSDIAVVKLAEAIPEGYHPALIQMEHVNLTKKDMLTFAGYGTIDPINDMGTGVLRKVQLNFKRFSWQDTEFLAQTTGKDTCRGDSGGPAFYEKNGELRVIGVTSRGACYRYGYYTYIPGMRSFMEIAWDKLKD